jgi:hypothetical protein
MQDAIYNALYPLHLSALEDILLPYLLFIVYGAIALWVRHESVGREYIKPAPESPSADVSAINYEEPTPFAIHVPSNGKVSKSLASLIESEMQLTREPSDPWGTVQNFTNHTK